ncbi:MAG: hypothetical protein WA211_11340 [Candidatus Acidiferrales bacterium]
MTSVPGPTHSRPAQNIGTHAKIILVLQLSIIVAIAEKLSE